MYLRRVAKLGERAVADLVVLQADLVQEVSRLVAELLADEGHQILRRVGQRSFMYSNRLIGTSYQEAL